MRLVRTWGAIASAWLAISIPSASRADTPNDEDSVLPCRPTIACTADITPPGTFEVEAGAIVKRMPKRTTALQTPLLVKYSMATWLQLQVGDSGFTHAWGGASATYVDDVEVGPKLHLADESRALPAVSFSATVSLPTLRDQTGYLRTYDLSLVGYVTKKFGPLEADLNVGLTEFAIDDAPLPQGLAALAWTLTLPSPFGAMLETYEYTDARGIAPHDVGTLAALTISPKKWLVFDVGGDLGWVPSTRSGSLFVGASFVPYVRR